MVRSNREHRGRGVARPLDQLDEDLRSAWPNRSGAFPRAWRDVAQPKGARRGFHIHASLKDEMSYSDRVVWSSPNYIRHDLWPE